jgi:crossover junction endodeoxyribonuclease RusA
MTLLAEFIVYGQARPAGALKIGHGGGRHWLHHRDGAPLRDWKNAIAQEAAAAMDGRRPYGGAVKLRGVFYVKRPAGHYGKRGLRPTALAYPVKRSVADVDKLARALLDALSGVVFADDSQVVGLDVRKRFADDRYVSLTVAVHAMDELDVIHAAAELAAKEEMT